MKKYIIPIFILLLSCYAVHGQISTREEPVSFNTGVSVLDGCSSYIVDRSVYTNTTFIGCNDLHIQNVSVTYNAKLKLDAPGAIIIDGPFEVELGCELEIK